MRAWAIGSARGASEVTVRDLQTNARNGEKLVMVTCYDYPSALLLDATSVDILLVGDSLANTVLGYETTLPVTLDEMIHHARAVRRGTRRAFTVVDLPFLSYQVSPEDALRSAGRVMKETLCQSVKIEGGQSIAPTVERLVAAGIPVMGHIGLTPQSVHVLGGFRTQGRDDETARRLKNDAEALADAGAYAIVLELVKPELAKCITQSIDVPTIGIGSGPDCSGQVQVLHDMVGMFPDVRLRHAQRYAEVGDMIRDAAEKFAQDVRAGRFARGS